MDVAALSDIGTAARATEAGVAGLGTNEADKLEPLVAALGKAVARQGLRAMMRDAPPTATGTVIPQRTKI